MIKALLRPLPYISYFYIALGRSHEEAVELEMEVTGAKATFAIFNL